MHIIYRFLTCMIFLLLIAESNTASIEKRSPFLRLDELSNRIYLAKYKIGAGLVDLYEM